MKLSVSSACLFLGIIFLVSPLWISHKNSKIFEQKSNSFFLFGRRERRDTKKKETAKEQL